MGSQTEYSSLQLNKNRVQLLYVLGSNKRHFIHLFNRFHHGYNTKILYAF